MRIAIVMDGLGGGGAEAQAVIAANELAHQGHRVSLISYGHDETNLVNLNQAEVEFIPVRSKGPLRLGRVFAIAGHLRRGKFDAVHCFHHPPCIWGGMAAILAGTRGLFFGYLGHGKVSWLQRMLLRWLSHRARAWIVNSDGVGRHIENYINVLPAKVRVVHNGLPEEKLNPKPAKTPAEVRAEYGLSAEVPLVALVGNLRPVKNIEMLLRVARRVADAGCEVQFVIAGDGTERDRLMKMSEEMGLDDRVKFIGFCKDVVSLLGAAAISVVTSITEGFSYAVLEGSVMGLPMVSTRNGGAEITIDDGETGYLVDVDDDEAMAERILTLLRDEALREKIGQRSAEHVRANFSAKAMCDALLEAYGVESLCRGRHSKHR